MNPPLSRLSAALGYTFRQPELLEEALTHRSASPHNNERLEFLGDALLNLIVAEYVFLHYPKASEGELSRLRSSLVKGETLAELARGLRLGDWLRLGLGELKSGAFAAIRFCRTRWRRFSARFIWTAVWRPAAIWCYASTKTAWNGWLTPAS